MTKSRPALIYGRKCDQPTALYALAVPLGREILARRCGALRGRTFELAVQRNVVLLLAGWGTLLAEVSGSVKTSHGFFAIQAAHLTCLPPIRAAGFYDPPSATVNPSDDK